MRPDNTKICNYRDENGLLIPSTNIKEFIEFSGIKPNYKVLDACCGAGRNYIALSKMGYDVYATDSNYYAIEIAKDESIKNEIPVKVFMSSLKLLPFSDEFFDAVYANAVPAKKTRESWDDVFRVMKKDARAYLNLIQGIMHYDNKYNTNDWFFETDDVIKWFPLNGRTADVSQRTVIENHVVRGKQSVTYLLLKVR